MAKANGFKWIATHLPDLTPASEFLTFFFFFFDSSSIQSQSLAHRNSVNMWWMTTPQTLCKVLNYIWNKNCDYRTLVYGLDWLKQTEQSLWSKITCLESLIISLPPCFIISCLTSTPPCFHQSLSFPAHSGTVQLDRPVLFQPSVQAGRSRAEGIFYTENFTQCAP